MKRPVHHGMLRTAGAVGLIAAIGSTVVRLQLLGDEPATQTYERLNRLWFGALVLVPIAVAVLYLAVRRSLDLLGHAGAAVAFIGAASGAAGNAIEFYLGQEQGFILFGLGLLIFAAGMFVLGLSARRMGATSVRTSRAIQAAGISGFLSSIAGPVGIVAAPLSAAAWVVIMRGAQRAP